jgi:ADP-ribose pyrophosphatase YjhB (NUDIX family)
MENAVKEAREETGLEVKIHTPNQPLCEFSDINQDPRAFMASITYVAEGSGILKPRPEEDAKSARVYDYDEVLGLLRNEKVWAMPHHRKIVQLYVDKIWRHNQFHKQ